MEITEITCLEDLAQILANLPGPDKTSAEMTERHEKQLTKPLGALGRLEKIVAWLATWQGCYPPKITKPACIIFAGNHGVVDRGVSAFPAEVTTQMVSNFNAGGAAINQICNGAGISLQVIPLNLDCPTADITQGPAMTEKEFISAFKIGANAVTSEMDLLCVGEMGIGNTTSAAALSYALFGGQAQDWTGPGTGVCGDTLNKKIKVVAAAVSKNKVKNNDPLELALCLGGRELSAIAGSVVAARMYRVPVLFDGYVATAALSPLDVKMKGALDHCLAAHLSAEPAHSALLRKLKKKPILDLEMRLGEGSGAALAVPIIRLAVSCHVGMATFLDAGVSEKM